MSGSLRPITFAVPGVLTTRTGGYIYDARVIDALAASGRDTMHLALPDGFPDPAPAAMDMALSQLAAVPADRALIIDGLAFGALDPGGLRDVCAPIVALVHHPLALETGIDPVRAAALRETETANLARAAAVLVPSPHTARTLVESFGVSAARITVAPPGHDRPSSPPCPSDPPLVLSVGSLVPRKGHDVLIDALADLVDLPWRAVIAGGMSDVSTAAALAERVAERGLSERVRFAGSVGADTLGAFYREATVFALATRYEGYGMVFAEALAHGVPIVSCRAGAVPDTVPAEAGLLVPPDDAGAFADALRAVLGDAGRHAALSAAASRAGAVLPTWADTAARVAGAVDALPAVSPTGR